MIHIRYDSLKQDAPYVYDRYDFYREEDLIDMAEEFEAYIELDSYLYDVLLINCSVGEAIPDSEYARIAEIIAHSLNLKGKI